MKHKIELIKLETHLINDQSCSKFCCRLFTVKIDNVELSGEMYLKALPYKSSYVILWPKHTNIRKHKDYKNIRRELLTKMIYYSTDKTGVAGMLSPGDVIR